MEMKRWLAMVLAVVMVLTMASCTKAPEEPEQTEVALMREDHLEWKEVEGGVELTAYTGKYAHLEVPEKVDGKFVVSLGTALVGNDRVKSVILPVTFERMDCAWFEGCDQLLFISGYNVLELEGELALPLLETLQLPSLEQIQSSDVAECPSLRVMQIPRARVLRAYSEDGTLCGWPKSLAWVELPMPMYARILPPEGADEVDGAVWSLVYEPRVGIDEEHSPEDAFRRIPSTAGQIYCTFFGVEAITVNGQEYHL